MLGEKNLAVFLSISFHLVYKILGSLQIC